MHHGGEEIDQVPLCEQQLVVFGAHPSRNLTRKMGLISVALIVPLIPDREGFNRTILFFREQDSIGTGVNSSREKDAYRNVGDFTKFHGNPQLMKDSLGNVLLGNTGQWCGMVPDVQ